MGRKKVLEKRQARLQKKINDLTERSQAADVTVDELRNIQSQILEIREDLAEVEEELESLEEDENGEGNEPPTGTPVQTRGGNPLASYTQVQAQVNSETRENVNPTATMEYRSAFMRYVQTGAPIPSDLLSRAAGEKGTTVTADIGAIIPETIMSEFIKEASKVYGHIYAKVRKLNVQGGVKFPISKLGATFKWITETTVSDKTKAGDIKEFVTFDYNIGEIRVATSLLAQVVSLPVFEREVTRIMLEAYVEAMDKAIISGDGNGQPLGITKDTRVKNIVEMTEAEFGDWTAWRKKLFAIVPLSKRGRGEFLFPASTVEAYLLTMKDANNRPLFKEATDLVMGNTAGSFFGRVTDLVEPDIIKDFATANEDDVVGIFWVPGDYAINTNLQFGMKRYFDDGTNEWINKGLTIVDGKILDTSGCYLIKKKNAAAASAKVGKAKAGESEI